MKVAKNPDLPNSLDVDENSFELLYLDEPNDYGYDKLITEGVSGCFYLGARLRTKTPRPRQRVLFLAHNMSRTRTRRRRHRFLFLTHTDEEHEARYNLYKACRKHKLEIIEQFGPITYRYSDCMNNGRACCLGFALSWSHDWEWSYHDSDCDNSSDESSNDSHDSNASKSSNE